MDGLILQIDFCQVIHVVTQLWGNNIMCDHRVEHLPSKLDAIVRQHHHVVLDILSHLDDFLRLVHLLEDINNS